jgi:thiol-disulfide isomerase/thioredoxin
MEWAIKMFGDTLLTHADPSKPAGVLKPTAEVLAGKKFVALYFSASWCGPCKKFTPFFTVTYEDLGDKDEVEVRGARRGCRGAGARRRARAPDWPKTLL